MITRLALSSLAFATLLVAADFWTKPYSDWTDKDVLQMQTDSPWADRMQVETGERGAIGNPDDKGGPMQGNLTAPITVMWQTALPVKQAMYGKAAATNPQAKQLLEREETQHILRLIGFPNSVRANAEDTAKLTADTVIKIKGKPDLHPSQIELSAAPAAPKGGPGGPGGPGGFKGKGGFGAPFDIFMVFPKDSIKEDDKEIEFITKVGKMNIRKKFKLKDMMYNGKLEL